MKKLLFTLMLMVGAFYFAPTAQAVYHKEMAELAKELNKAVADEGCKVTYDPAKDRIIMIFPKSLFDADEVEALNSIDFSEMRPVFVSVLLQSMGKETCEMMGSLFGLFDTNLTIQMNLGNKVKTITLTPQELLDAARK